MVTHTHHEFWGKGDSVGLLGEGEDVIRKQNRSGNERVTLEETTWTRVHVHEATQYMLLCVHVIVTSQCTLLLEANCQLVQKHSYVRTIEQDNNNRQYNVTTADSIMWQQQTLHTA